MTGVVGLPAGRRRLRHKPFSLRELTGARCARAAARRHGARSAPVAIAGRILVADFDRGGLAVDGRRCGSPGAKFELLPYLAQNKNRVVSRDRLLERVWATERLVETRSVDVHVGRPAQQAWRSPTAD